MAEAKKRTWLRVDRRELMHCARTATAAMVSLLIGRLFRLPESYWAAVTTLVVMQSTLGAALTVSRQRLAGNALGAAMGALLATYSGPNVMVFGAGVFTIGVICAALRIERSAYRFAGITLAIILLVGRSEPAWVMAIHRFVEISVGIAVGLILTAVWPESQTTAA